MGQELADPDNFRAAKGGRDSDPVTARLTWTLGQYLNLLDDGTLLKLVSSRKVVRASAHATQPGRSSQSGSTQEMLSLRAEHGTPRNRAD